MTTTPEKKPSSPKIKEEADLNPAELERERELEAEELLADLPALIPPTKLRIRQRNKIFAIYFRIRDAGLFDEDRSSKKAPTTEENMAILETIADIDEFAESIAYDAGEYAEWSAKQPIGDPQPFLAILMRYAVASGE